MMAPLLALGHGVEFLLAKLEVSPGVVRVEVTADCEGNYMLPDREMAMAAIRRLFVIGMRDDRGGLERQLPWEQLAGLEFEEREQLDPSVPLPPDPSWAERRHQLVTGIWVWKPPVEGAFRLLVPVGETVDTLLWRSDGGAASQAVPWRIMISGDETEWLQMPRLGVLASWGWDWWRVGGVLGAGLVLAGVLRFFLSRRRLV